MQYLLTILVFAAVMVLWTIFYSRWRHAGAKRSCCSAAPGEPAPPGCCGGANHLSDDEDDDGRGDQRCDLHPRCGSPGDPADSPAEPEPVQR